MAEREGLGIVEALFLRGGFLIPQFSPIPFAFSSHYCELHFYHSSHSRSSEMDLSRHKSHPVFSSLRFSLFFLFTLGFCSRWTLYAKNFTYGRNGSEGYLYQTMRSDGRNFVKDFYSRLTVCKDVALEVSCFILPFYFLLFCYSGCEVRGLNFCKRAQGKHI
jgi:hypothetical protein